MNKQKLIRYGLYGFGCILGWFSFFHFLHMNNEDLTALSTLYLMTIAYLYSCFDNDKIKEEK